MEIYWNEHTSDTQPMLNFFGKSLDEKSYPESHPWIKISPRKNHQLWEYIYIYILFRYVYVYIYHISVYIYVNIYTGCGPSFPLIES